MTSDETQSPVGAGRERSLSRQTLATGAARSWRWLTIVLCGLAVHLPALRGAFIWDDVPLVARNPLIKSPLFVAEAFRHFLFPGEFSGHYRPVQTLSYIVDYWFWDTNTIGYHASNIFWHIASGVLLFFLLRRLLTSVTPVSSARTSDAAWLLALLWVVHPVHSAAVDYISGRADSLAFCFACSSWLLYLRARDTARIPLRISLYAAAPVLALLALCSRETGGLWMLLFLLHFFAFDRRRTTLRAKFAVVAACALVVCVYLTARHLPETRRAPVAPAGWSQPMRATLMLRALGDYGELLIFPVHLHVERTVLNRAAATGANQWRQLLTGDRLALAGLALLAAFGVGALRKEAGRSARIFGASWFVLAYLPTSNLFDLNATVAEHWLYLPSVGLLIFAAGCVSALPRSWSRPVALAACAAVAILGIRGAVRSSDWVNPETFFRRTFAAGGTSSRIGVNLAVIYAQRGEHARAEEILRKVLQVSPNYPIARSNLALALTQQGKTAEAAALLQPATATTPALATGYRPTFDAALGLARLRLRERDYPAALVIVDEALRDFPGTWELVSLRAQVVAGAEGNVPALRVVEEFARTHWWHFPAAMTLGKLYAQTGDSARAESAFRQASRLDVYDAESLNACAFLEANRGHLEAACAFGKQALTRQPTAPRQYHILAELLQNSGHLAEAKIVLANLPRNEGSAEPIVAAD